MTMKSSNEAEQEVTFATKGRVVWLLFPGAHLPRDTTGPRGWKARSQVRGDTLCERSWAELRRNKICFAAFPSCRVLHAFS